MENCAIAAQATISMVNNAEINSENQYIEFKFFKNGKYLKEERIIHIENNSPFFRIEQLLFPPKISLLHFSFIQTYC